MNKHSVSNFWDVSDADVKRKYKALEPRFLFGVSIFYCFWICNLSIDIYIFFGVIYLYTIVYSTLVAVNMTKTLLIISPVMDWSRTSWRQESMVILVICLMWDDSIWWKYVIFVILKQFLVSYVHCQCSQYEDWIIIGSLYV